MRETETERKRERDKEADLLNLRWKRATKESTLGAAEAAIRSSAPTPKPAISLTVTLAMAPALLTAILPSFLFF
jgi:hypothetical protein